MLIKHPSTADYAVPIKSSMTQNLCMIQISYGLFPNYLSTCELCALGIKYQEIQLYSLLMSPLQDLQLANVRASQDVMTFPFWT